MRLDVLPVTLRVRWPIQGLRSWSHNSKVKISFTASVLTIPTMKIASCVLASLLAVASATKLRGSVTAPVEHTDGQIVVKGLIKEVSAEDLDTISHSIVASYNKVYAHTGHSMDSFHLQAAAMVDQRCTNCRKDDDSKDVEGILTIITAAVGQRCTNCRKDDDAAELMPTQIASLHATFEAAVCHTLQASGSVNFANANGCSVSYLTKEQDSEEGQVLVQGTLRDMSAADMKIFKETLTATYKEAFEVTDNTHFSIEQAAATVGQRCTNCRKDDDLAAEAGVLAVVRKVGQR